MSVACRHARGKSPAIAAFSAPRIQRRSFPMSPWQSLLILSLAGAVSHLSPPETSSRRKVARCLQAGWFVEFSHATKSLWSGRIATALFSTISPSATTGLAVTVKPEASTSAFQSFACGAYTLKACKGPNAEALEAYYRPALLLIAFLQGSSHHSLGASSN